MSWNEHKKMQPFTHLRKKALEPALLLRSGGNTIATCDADQSGLKFS